MKRFSALFAAATLALIGASFAAAPAQAHDTVVSTSPAAGDTVEAGIISVAVTFEEPLMQTATGPGGSSQILVSSAGGSSPTSCASIANGNELIAQTEIDTPGTYTATWRGVAEDGHVISDTFDFKVENTKGYASSGAVAACPMASGVNPSASAEPYGVSGSSSDTGTPAPVVATPVNFGGMQPIDGLIYGFAVITLVSVVGGLLVQRNQRRGHEKKLNQD
jgi:methionine-rich copper-binding protein CopC